LSCSSFFLFNRAKDAEDASIAHCNLNMRFFLQCGAWEGLIPFFECASDGLNLPGSRGLAGRSDSR
jgi:hypothetical protein